MPRPVSSSRRIVRRTISRAPMHFQSSATTSALQVTNDFEGEVGLDGIGSDSLGRDIKS
jgi:hypothetical protein